MIDTNELRRLAQAAISKMSTLDPEFVSSVTPLAVLELLDRLEAAESDALEQDRLNGKGSEREAALMAKLEAAEKDVALKEEVIDSLAAVVKRLDAQCDAAERERDECTRRRLEAADHFAAQTELMKKKCGELRAKITEMEQQEPVAWLHETRRDSDVVTDAVKHVWGKVAVGSMAAYSIPLYTLPGAQGEQ